MRDPQFKQVRSERMWKSEGLFAEAKQNHNLSRAKYRGRPKVQIQAFLSAIAQNVKRLVALFYCWLLARWLRKQQNQMIASLNEAGDRLFQQARMSCAGIGQSIPEWIRTTNLRLRRPTLRLRN